MPARQPQRSGKSATANSTLQHYSNAQVTHSAGSLEKHAINDTLETEMYWRLLTRNYATEVVITTSEGKNYFETDKSTLNRIVVTLPRTFIPIEYTWPVQGCIVALVETGCYERELIEVCKQSGAMHIECYSRNMVEPFVVLIDYAMRLAA